MRDDLARLRRQLERARPWAKAGRVAVRTEVLEALLALVEAGDKLGFGQGTGYYRARAVLTESLGEPGELARAIAGVLGTESVEALDIVGGVEP